MSTTKTINSNINPDWADITGTPTTLSGYGITDAQPLDADLTTVAGLTPSNDDFLQRKAGAWANRTIAQVKSDLSLTGTNSGDQTSIVGITGSLAEFNTALTGADFATGGGVITGTSSGTNTGDQTSIVGITGTLAQFNTAITDADILSTASAASTYQPLDATLTALAAANWAVNALPIGTGADTLSQTSFAANTFPARASTGDLVAKTITDFGLSLLDDADATAGRATLSLGTVATHADSEYVHIAGIETITGDKSFSAEIGADGGLDTLYVVSHGSIEGTQLSINKGSNAVTQLFLSSFNASNRADFEFQMNASTRWRFSKDSTAESGSNAGGNFTFSAFDDSGVSLGNVFTVTRSTRVLDFTVAPTFASTAAATRTNLSLGTAATQNTGTSGANLPFANGTNTWANTQTFTLAPVFTDQSGSRTALGLGTAAVKSTGTSGNTVPLLDGNNTWSGTNAYSAAVTISANLVNDAGSIRLDRSGDAAIGQYFLDVDATQVGEFQWRTGTSSRWSLRKNATAEGGSDAGSDMQLFAYSDAGASLGTVYVITRATRILAFTVSPTAPTPSAGDNSTKVMTTAYFRTNSANSSYRNLFEREASHTAGRVNGTYAIGSGDAAPISGTGTLYTWGVFYYDPADHPTLDGLAPKLRVRGQIVVNDTAPTSTFVIALHPVTHTGVTGGAGLNLFTIGAAVAGSAATTITTPAADSLNQVVGSDFAAPTAGWYCLGFVQSTATVATNSHMHISAQLQMRNN
jgi:hypothetical protein